MAAVSSYRARGIVLRRTKLGETDLIVTLLADTPTQLRAVAKGARKPGARLTGVVGLGNEVELQLHVGRSLDVITEGTLVASRADCVREFERASLMEVVLDVAAELTVEGEHDERMLPMTRAALGAVSIARTGLLAYVAAAYVFKAVSMQGFRPVFDACVACGAAVDPRAAETVRLSFEDGGVLCDDCADGMRGAMRKASTLAWASSLIRMTFAQITALPEAPDESSQGYEVLELAREWLHHYPGIRPRALEFVFSAGAHTL